MSYDTLIMNFEKNKLIYFVRTIKIRCIPLSPVNRYKIPLSIRSVELMLILLETGKSGLNKPFVQWAQRVILKSEVSSFRSKQ
jgi:hypothetical protein